MYNPYQGQQYGRPGSFGPFGGQPGGPPPGMPAPAWMGAPGAPGVGLPPGVQSASARPTSRPGGLPPGFDPNNLPKIDFSAPVIRLGAAAPNKLNAGMITTGLSGRRDSSTEGLASVNRAGVGAGGVEQQRSTLRESMQSLVPSTKDEIARTVFVDGITDGVGDDGVERILQSAGKLRKWSRATDADGRTCSFGFAEYEAAEHLATAVEVLKEIKIPKKRQDVKPIKTEHKSEVKQEHGSENGVDEEVEMSTLLVVVDENSLNYLEHYQASRGEEDPSRAQARLDAARASLSLVLSSLAKPSATSDLSAADVNGDQSIPSSDPPAEIVNITLAADDELSDIPLEMRETVAQEIASFRYRSVRRDMERLRREEELEAAERVRISNIGGRPSRMTSPPAFANSNNIPLGPRAAQPPTGPKASFTQIPRDYTSGVNFLPSSAAAAADEDDSASDSELENRRQLKKTTEQEKAYLDQERRWLNRERSRTAAVEREAQRDISDVALQQRAADAAGKRLAEYDDDVEAGRRAEEYYQDRSLWVRNRAAYRHRETEWDERDRADERRERQRREQGQEEAEILADSFLDRHAVALGPQAAASSGDRGEATASAAAAKKFTLALGAAAQRSTAGRRTVAEVEGLLEDEEDEGQERKRTLIPIQETAMGDVKAMTQDLTAEQRDEAIRQLAAEIPTEKEGLWKWPVKWDLVTEEVIDGRLRPFVEKKIVEYLGVQEQMLVELVESHVRKRGGAEELVGELEGAMEEEAEQLVKKLWRMIIFFSESERRGLSA